MDPVDKAHDPSKDPDVFSQELFVPWEEFRRALLRMVPSKGRRNKKVLTKRTTKKLSSRGGGLVVGPL